MKNKKTIIPLLEKIIIDIDFKGVMYRVFSFPHN